MYLNGMYVNELTGEEFEDIVDYKESLGLSDFYHFSVPFEYIEKNYGNGQYDIATAIMEVDVRWDNAELGYKYSISCLDEHLIKSEEGNADLNDFFENEVKDKVEDLLGEEGVEVFMVCIF